jgi:hypothetical protein
MWTIAEAIFPALDARLSSAAGVPASGVCRRCCRAGDDDAGQKACREDLVHHDHIPFRYAPVRT